MGSDKKSKDKKKGESKEQHKKAPAADTHNHAQEHKTKSSKQKNHSKSQKAGGWSWLARVNMLLLLVAVGLAGRAVYLSSDGDLSELGLEKARVRLLSSWATLSALTSEHGGAVLGSARDWAAEKAGVVDRYLTEKQGPLWAQVKDGAARGAAVVRHYGAIAGEKLLMVTAQVVRVVYEAGLAGWKAAKPHCDAALTAAKPHWDTARAAAGRYWNATATAAAPYWKQAVERGTAVKAGVLEAAARLQRDGGPVLAEWAAAAGRAAGDAWGAVQREAPKLAAKLAAWLAAAWETVCREAPVYWAALTDKAREVYAGIAGGA